MKYITMFSVNMTFGNKTVIRNFDYTWKANQPVLVTGPSGSGKTTLLRLIAGLIPPSSGRIDGSQNLSAGMVFQSPRLLPWKTAWQNVALPLWNKGISSQEAEKFAREILKDFNLEEAADSFPSKLSGGMAQRVALARALVIEPDVLLLDEPLNGLDTGAKNNVIQILSRYLKNNETICICVSHYPDELLSLAKDHLYFMGNGILKKGEI